jgi:hypothetical protein
MLAVTAAGIDVFGQLEAAGKTSVRPLHGLEGRPFEIQRRLALPENPQLVAMRLKPDVTTFEPRQFDENKERILSLDDIGHGPEPRDPAPAVHKRRRTGRILRPRAASLPQNLPLPSTNSREKALPYTTSLHIC